jgi:hypothetical protein
VKGHKQYYSRQGNPVADEIRMTEDDTVAPDASPIEDFLELRLLTAGPPTGPIDFPLEDHRLDEP